MQILINNLILGFRAATVFFFGLFFTLPFIKGRFGGSLAENI